MFYGVVLNCLLVDLSLFCFILYGSTKKTVYLYIYVCVCVYLMNAFQIIYILNLNIWKNSVPSDDNDCRLLYND